MSSQIMASMVDVFVGNYTVIDTDLYDLWLYGYTGLCFSLIMQIKQFSSHLAMSFLAYLKHFLKISK